jgi:hypothetical protein
MLFLLALLLPLLADPARGLRGADTPPTPFLAQTRSGDASSRFIWSVALPAQATIRLRQGGSLSRRVVRVTSAALTLTAGSQSPGRPSPGWAVAMGQPP